MAVQKNFVVKNGIEVNENLIIADRGSSQVGIATTNVQYTLHVNGGIGATHLNVIGVSTFNLVHLDGRVTAGTSEGTIGQYLVSTGIGVTWGSVPTVRSLDAQTASSGQTIFNTAYSVGLLDVYVNGVRLSSSEFTATDSATVVLDDACFGGETVEFISYSPFGIGVGGSSIQGMTIQEEGGTVGSPLQVTSLNFVGNISTVVGSGVGATVYFSDYVASAGISSYSNSAGIATYSSTSGISSYSNVSGVCTVAIGLSDSSNINTIGIITASGGFASIAGTTPITIDLVGNQLTFNAVGIGSTTLTLF
jgi:hypothetical protein